MQNQERDYSLFITKKFVTDGNEPREGTSDTFVWPSQETMFPAVSSSGQDDDKDHKR